MTKNEKNKIGYIKQYKNSPVGNITIQSDGNAITGLWLDGQKYDRRTMEGIIREEEVPVLKQAEIWLDAYFCGENPPIDFLLNPYGTLFQKCVWEELQKIPYGAQTTYGALAKTVAKKMGKKSMSAQAVGGAVGHNPISILIPCHRVIGSDGSMTGYAGGIEKKIQLLQLEKTIVVDADRL